MAQGAPNSAGTRDTKVQRVEEGLATDIAPVFDAGRAEGLRQPKPKAVIDTSGTSGNTPDADLKRGEPGAW